MMKKLLLLFMMLAFALPAAIAGEKTIVINRNEGIYEDGTGVYYCSKGGITMTFSSGLNNVNYLVEHQQVVFDIFSTNYVIKKIKFNCLDNTTNDNLDCFYWGPSTIHELGAVATYTPTGTYTYSGYIGTWVGGSTPSKYIKFVTEGKPVRFGSVEITIDKEFGDIYEKVTTDSEIQNGQTYVLVSQYASKALGKEDYYSTSENLMCFTSTPVTLLDNNNRVKVTDEVQLMKLVSSGNSSRPWYIKVGDNYMRRRSSLSGSSSGAAYGQGYNLHSASSVTSYEQYFRVSISINGNTNQNALIRFDHNTSETSGGKTFAIRHYNGGSLFRDMDYSSNNNEYASNQRVYLYKPAQTYYVTTNCLPDDNSGYITLGDGVLNDGNGNYTSQQYDNVNFFVGPTEGWGVGAVTVTNLTTNEVTTLTPTNTSDFGNDYQFPMPGANVSVTANFLQPFNIDTICNPTGGGVFNFISGSTDFNGQHKSNEGKTVTFKPEAADGYTFNSVTLTDNGTTTTLTPDANGVYSFTMPGNDVTLTANFDPIPYYVITTQCQPSDAGRIDVYDGITVIDNAITAAPGDVVTFWVEHYNDNVIQSVTVNREGGEAVTLNVLDGNEFGQRYSFTMPTGNVNIMAAFEPSTDLYLIGTAMGRTSWVPAGPRFNYDVNNEQYYLDVYFKGGNSNNEVDQAFGYFSLAKDIDHSITWQTARPDQGSWNAIQNVRLAAEYNYYVVQDGSTDVVLYGDRNDNSFKIPAGVYRIIVNKDMNRMSIVETHLSLNFDPVSGTEVNPGQVVTISSDLEATVHGIAQQYSINEDAQAFKNTTDNWVNQENGNTVILNQLPPATVTVQAKANIGYIVVPGTAVYNMVPASYTIEAICNPEVAGTITVASTAHQGDLITFTVGTEPDYVLSSVLIYNNSDPTAQPITPTDNGDGTYSFTMPADNVVIMANFDLKTYDITTVCDPVQGGTITLEGTAADGNEVPNQTVTMTVDANIGFKVTDVTVQQDGTTTPVDVTDNGDGTYSFTMPEGDVTVIAHYELEGVIFKIVTDPSEIVGGEYYTMITREGDRVLNNIAPGAATNFYSSTDIVGWVTPGEYDYVKLDGRACFFSPEDVTDSSISSSLYRTGYLKTSGGYIGIEPNVENNGYAHLALYDSKDNVKPFSMSIDTFWSSSTDHYAYIYYDYENSHSNRDAWQAFFDDLEDNPYFEYNSFLLENTTLSHYDTWLYKPAKMYNITTVVNPDGTESSLELDGGAVGNMGAEGSTIVVWPVAGEGYALSSLVVTIDGTGEVVEATPNIDGSYSFIMPSNDVTITATFTTGYHINWVCDPEDTGEIIVTPTAYAGQHVAFEVLPCDGYEVTGITVTKDGDQDEISFTENEDGTYSFNMPDDHVTIKATLVLHSEEATLQYIEKWDTYESGTRVTVRDELIGTWMAKQYLWAKDQYPQRSNVYLERDVNVDPSDFLRNHLKREVDENYFIPWQPDEWDQSNWVMLDFSQIPGFEDWEENAESYLAMREAMQTFVDNKIEARTITGRYLCEGEPIDAEEAPGDYPKVQHIIVLEKRPKVVEPVTTPQTTLGYPGYVQDPKEWSGRFYDDPSKYSYNHYMSYNFNRDNTIASGTPLNYDAYVYWDEHGIVLDSDTRYFFMNPKDQEVAQVCGVWVGQKQFEFNGETILGDVFDSYAFSPEEGVNQFGFSGAFYVPSRGSDNDLGGWKFNRLISDNEVANPIYGMPGIDDGKGSNGELKVGEAYIFHAAIQYPYVPFDEPSKAPLRDLEPYGSNPKYYTVYPLDLMSPGDAFTAVSEVKSQESTEIDSIRYYNIMGQESDVPFDGINIRVIRYQDGSMISRKILR
ncbi:MAG: hypothetical protein SPL96_05995 [Bacteroidales bacterium]|nr:hypothetical protein [Bacteroidales bacterium]